jgi:hypothetical protein
MKVFLIVLVLVSAGGAAWWVSSKDIKRMTMEVTALESNVVSLDGQIVAQKELLRLKAVGNELAAKVAAKTTERDELLKQVEQVSQENAQMGDAMVRAILGIRERTIGQTFPEVALPNRAVLKNATVQSIGAEGIRFKHADGITLAGLTELPAELRDRLRLDEAPLERDPATVATVTRKPAAAEAPDAFEKYEEKVKQARALVLGYEREMEALNSRWSKIVDHTMSNNNYSNRQQAETAHKNLYAQYVAAKDRLIAAKRELEWMLQNPPKSKS